MARQLVGGHGQDRVGLGFGARFGRALRTSHFRKPTLENNSQFIQEFIHKHVHHITINNCIKTNKDGTIGK